MQREEKFQGAVNKQTRPATLELRVLFSIVSNNYNHVKNRLM